MTTHSKTPRVHGDQRARQPDQSAMFEALEARIVLSSFLYHGLGAFLDPFHPMFVLRPSGEDSPARTIASAVDGAGDVNHDGHADIIAGAGGVASAHDDDRAVAAIFSGANGAALFTFSDGFTEFGGSVAGIGDVNGDGTPDVVVGSPRFDPDMHGSSSQVGRAYIYSGADGSLIRALTGEAAGDRFGGAVGAAGDFNNDGRPDVIIGATGADAGGRSRGRAYVFSGADGSLLATFSGAGDDDAFGYAVAGAADVNGDGFADVIVGAPGPFNGTNRDPGYAVVYSGQSHGVLFTLTGDQDGDRFGFAVDGAGDVNGDGRPDLIVGAPNAANNNGGHIPAAGVARVFSGVNGAVLLTFRGDAPNGNLGAAVAGAGDLNFDGHADVLIGAPAASPASNVTVYSGSTGGVLARFSHTDRDLVGSDRLSTSVAVVGDVDGDGFADFAFAGTQDANPERNDRGRMYVFSGVEAAGLWPEGFSDDLDIWGTAGSEGFLVLNGNLFLLPTHQGFMPGDRVIDVNRGDTVLGMGADGSPFLWVNNTRMPLSGLITMENGPMGMFSDPRAVDLTDSGLVLVRRLRDGATPTTWLLDHGTITYLFDGDPVAMNEARSVIATIPGDDTHSILWTPPGGMVQLAGIHAVDLNESTVIVGSAPDSGAPASLRTVVWTNGAITGIGVIQGGDGFIPTGINNGGQIVGRYTVVATGATSGYFFSPQTGIVDIKACLRTGDGEPLRASTNINLIDINNGGWVLGKLEDVHVGFLLEPFAGDGPFSTRADVRIVATLSDSGGLFVVAINRADEVILFRQDASTGQWTRVDVSRATDASGATAVVVERSVQSGGIIYAVSTSSGLLLLSQNASGQWSARNLTTEIQGATPIVRGLFALRTIDGFVIIGGLDASGDLVIYGETAGRNSGGGVVWAFDDLTRTQLAPHGLATPAFTGKLVAYVTAWNGLNIAGLDANGDIQVVWTAPGLGGWTTSNLTTITGAPVLTGGLATHVTSWGGINLIGIDSDGDTVVTWWVPEFGGAWRHNNFTADFGGSRLRADSVTAYVTPWGGLNIAGLTDSGEIVVYWWVPGFDRWRVDPLPIDAHGDRRRTPVQRLDSFAGEDGSLNLFAAGRFGDVLHYHWRPGMDWQMEDLSSIGEG